LKNFTHGGSFRQLAQAAVLPEREVLNFDATETAQSFKVNRS
jgi:hypothetical protein